MKRKQELAVLLLAVTAASLTGCHEDINPWQSGTEGRIAPLVSLDSKVESASSSKAQSRAVQAPEDLTVGDLELTISKNDGSFTRTWTSVSEYDPETKFTTGQYKVEASYGSVRQEGFGRPAFYGSADALVRENETTSVSLTASLANAMLSIDYTDAFRSYMTDWNANAHSDGGEYIYYSRTETRPAYFNPGTLTLNVYVEKPNGKSATFEVAKINTQARHHYHVTVDVNNGDAGGDAVLVVTFDDTLDMEEVVINLSDELLDAPAPVISGSGDLTDGHVYSYTFGDAWNTAVRANVVAQGGIAEITLTTSSQSLIAQGWPSEVDLMSADANTLGIMKTLGLKDLRFDGDARTMAVIDFSEVALHLTETESNTNSFVIVVKDKMTKVSEPFSFAINTVPMVLTLANPATLAVGADRLSFELSYNGDNPSGSVKFQLGNDRGTWNDAKTVSIEKGASENIYNVTVEVPADSKAVTVRAVTAVKNSEALTVNRVVPDYSVSYEAKDIWARRATVTMAYAQGSADELARLATVFVSSDGTNFVKANASVSGKRLAFDGLTPGTKYTVRVSVTGDVNQSCIPVEFTTEAAAGVPNGDFETLGVTLSESSLEQNGKWSISAGINYQTTLTYTISEPAGWASVNAKTTSSSTRNSLFVVPSTFNTTLNWVSTVPNIRFLGTGGGSETPSSYAGFTAQSGANAMVIRNVAWDPAGSVPGVWRKEFVGSDEYYNHNIPDISRVSAGKMFLGTYAYTDGSETYNEGTAFSSRPAVLKGFYIYTNDPGDTAEKGTVSVQVMSGNTVIGTGSAKLGAASSYTAFSVPVEYIADAAKATAVRIMFCSSDKSRENDIAVSTFNGRYESARHGATLVVDNLTFEY